MGPKGTKRTGGCHFPLFTYCLSPLQGPKGPKGTFKPLRGARPHVYSRRVPPLKLSGGRDVCRPADKPEGIPSPTMPSRGRRDILDDGPVLPPSPERDVCWRVLEHGLTCRCVGGLVSLCRRKTRGGCQGATYRLGHAVAAAGHCHHYPVEHPAMHGPGPTTRAATFVSVREASFRLWCHSSSPSRFSHGEVQSTDPKEKDSYCDTICSPPPSPSLGTSLKAR